MAVETKERNVEELGEALWELVEVGQGDDPARYALDFGSTTIGRSDGCNIFVSGNDKISLCHCKIACTKDGTKPFVEDSSTNGTFVNGTKIPKYEYQYTFMSSNNGFEDKKILQTNAELNDGDVIRVTPNATDGSCGYRIRLISNKTELNDTPIYDESEELVDDNDEEPPNKRRAVQTQASVDNIKTKTDSSDLPSTSSGSKNELEQHLLCGICQDIFHNCVSTQPCMHSFCGSCFTSWMEKSNRCPICRKNVKTVARNHIVNSLVEVYLKSHPGKIRSKTETEEMDHKDKIKSDAVSVGSIATPNFSFDNDESDSEREVDSDDDDQDDGVYGFAGIHHFASARVMFTPPPPVQSICRQCPASQNLMPANDPLRSFTCSVNQVHLMCRCCYQPMPDRRNLPADPNAGSIPPVSCSSCQRFFCSMYWQCQSNTCRGCLRKAKDFEFDDASLRNVIRGNVYESSVIENYVRSKHKQANDFYKDCITKVEDDPSILPSTWNISMDDPLCRTCSMKFFQDIAFEYRKHMSNDELPGHVTQRSDCYWGKHCRTQTHNFSHASRYNHICEQTKFNN